MEQGWNKSGHIPGDALEQFSGSVRAIWVCQRAPKRVQNGQKQHFRAISGSGGPPKALLTRETVPLNRPRCALTCSTYIPHCSASAEPQHSLMAPKLSFWAIWGPFGVLLGPPIGPPDQRNGSIALPRMCPDLFHLYSTLFCQFGATRPAYGSKMTILGRLGPFWGPLGAPQRPP